MWISVKCENCTGLIDKNIDHKRLPMAYREAQKIESRLPYANIGTKSSALLPNGFSLTISLSPIRGSSIELRRIKACCEQSYCADVLARTILTEANKIKLKGELIKNLTMANFTYGCSGSSSHSTLFSWPGDQDRLNWLYDEFVNQTSNSFPTLAISIAKQEYRPMLLFHWAEDQQIKSEFSVLATNRTRLEYAPQVSFADWDKTLAWATMNKTLPVFLFLNLTDSPFSTAHALELIDQGAFKLVN